MRVPVRIQELARIAHLDGADHLDAQHVVPQLRRRSISPSAESGVKCRVCSCALQREDGVDRHFVVVDVEAQFRVRLVEDADQAEAACPSVIAAASIFLR